MRIFIDMDGTLAKWNNVAFEQLYEKGYYRNLEPNQDILNDTKNLIKQGLDVYIMSCYLSDSLYALAEKKEWVKEYLPELDENKYVFVPYGENKAKYFNKLGLMPITNKDYLVDDYSKNLFEWKEMGGQGIKYLNGINHTKGTWNGLMVSYDKSSSYYPLVGENADLISLINAGLSENQFIHNKVDLSRKYPILSQAADFEDLCANLDKDTLDDMEYILYLWDNSNEQNSIFSVNEYGGLEVQLNNADYNNKERLAFSEVIIPWWEGSTGTKDLINEISDSKMINKETNDFDLDEIDI